jgi:hypothetical protein
MALSKWPCSISDSIVGELNGAKLLHVIHIFKFGLSDASWIWNVYEQKHPTRVSCAVLFATYSILVLLYCAITVSNYVYRYYY